MLGKCKCPSVDASVARPGVRFSAWSAAVFIAGPGAPGMRTGGREKKGDVRVRTRVSRGRASGSGRGPRPRASQRTGRTIRKEG